jgi:HSP20 family protein
MDAFFWHVGGELQRMSEEMMRLRPQFANRRAWEPRIDLLEDEEHFLVKGEIAGVRGEDIQLLFIPERHVLVIRGTRNEEELNCTGAYQLEIYYGEFEREIKLPDVDISPQHIRATYRNGILLVSIPKKVAVAVEGIVIESK